MSTSQKPFSPLGPCLAIAASAGASASQSLRAAPGPTCSALLVNSSASVAFFVTGVDATVVATTGGIPVPPGRDRVIEMPGGHTAVAAILAAGAVAANVYAQIGAGGN